MATRLAHRGFLLVVLVFLWGCASTYTEKIEEGLSSYRQGRMAQAESSFNDAESRTRDVHLTRLELGMTRLALDRPADAAASFQRAIDRMDSLTTGNNLRTAASYVLDDTLEDYPGAPFEQICARLFNGMAYLLQENPYENFSAAYRDMDIKMEQIEAYYERSYMFDGDGESAEFSFQIPPVAKYFAALAAEQRHELDNAEIYLKQALEGMPGCSFFRSELKRVEQGGRENRLFVFALLGMVPHKIETTSEELTAVLRGIKALLAVVKPKSNPGPIERTVLTAPVQIPGYPQRKPLWHGGFEVVPSRGGGGGGVSTQLVADFDRYAREEYRALLPGLLIRTAVRRLIKEATGQMVGQAVIKDNKKASKLIGDVVSSLFSVAETVDTRSWCTLPYAFHAASLELPAGCRSVILTPQRPCGGTLGPPIELALDRSNTEPAYMLIIQPGPRSRPFVLVDAEHRIAPATP